MNINALRRLCALLCALVAFASVLSGCGYSSKDLENARKEGYQQGAQETEWEYEYKLDIARKDAYSEGYNDCYGEYDLDSSAHVQCPVCGYQLWVNKQDGSIDDCGW